MPIARLRAVGKPLTPLVSKQGSAISSALASVSKLIGWPGLQHVIDYKLDN